MRATMAISHPAPASSADAPDRSPGALPLAGLTHLPRQESQRRALAMLDRLAWPNWPIRR
jgi:hypothetical protein